MAVRRSHHTATFQNRRSLRPRLRLCALAALALCTMPAGASSFNWLAGDYTALIGTNPLDAQDMVTATTLANKNFNAIDFVNNGGLVWATADRMGFLTSTFANNGLVDLQADADLQFAGGSASNFTNSDVFRKSGANGVSAIKANIVFANTGTIDAQVGTIDFVSGLATFHGGTQFVGAGSNRVSSNATFNDSFTSSNLLLASGNFTGANATINGTVQWNGGQFLGNWQLPTSQTLNAGAGSDKNFNNVTFTNDATINWQSADRVGFLSSTLTNNGLFDIQGDANLSYAGGSASTFTNSTGAIFRKSAGVGSTVVGSNINFVNHGTVDAQSGLIDCAGGLAAFHAGTTFTGAGTNRISVSGASFNGDFMSANLLLHSGAYNGNAAVLNGHVDWTGGSLVGGWTIAQGHTLVADGSSNKNFSGVVLDNQGTIEWRTSDRLGFLTSTIHNQGLIDIQQDANLTYAGGSPSIFINDGVLRKSGGDGTTVIGSNVQFSNPGTIEAMSGTIQLPDNFNNTGTIMGTAAIRTNTLTNTGTIAPGASPGMLALDGDLVLTAASKLDIEIGSLSSFDVLAVSGTALLDGILAVRQFGSYVPQIGDSFTFLTYAARTGQSGFDSITPLGWGGGVTFTVAYNAGNAQLTVAAVPEPETYAMLLVGLT